MQEERIQEGKKKITSWERMKIRLKAQFLPGDYEAQIHKRLQNLKQRELDVNAYIEEFHKLSLRARKHENEVEKLARYLNGLSQNIQGEISILTLDTIHKCFQLALRAEEKIKRRSEQNQKHREVRILEVEETLVEGSNHQEVKSSKAKKVVETLKEEHLDDPIEEGAILGAGLETQEEEIKSSLIGVIIAIKLDIP